MSLQTAPVVFGFARPAIRRLWVALLAVPLAAAGPTGSIDGRLLVSSATPGGQPGKVSAHGIKGRIEIRDDKGAIVTTAEADDNGKFTAELAPGSYVLHLTQPSRPGGAADQKTIVAEGRVTYVYITYDAGIR
jgi:hypothetical protein